MVPRGGKMTKEIKTYIALVTEEYKTLRDESKQASINMWTAMQWDQP